MNGISSTLKEEIQKTKDKSKKEKFKFISAILITNIMVAMLCLPTEETKSEVKKKNEKLLHAHHEMMVLPLEILIPENAKEKLETLVTLVSKDKKIIIQKAYLHEELKNKNEISQFKIEIPSSEIVKASDHLSETMLAIPYVEKPSPKNIKRGSKYEINI
jgi:hypothetical protein